MPEGARADVGQDGEENEIARSGQQSAPLDEADELGKGGDED